jgi:carbamate kinase
MAGTAVVAIRSGDDGQPIDVAAVARSLRALIRAGWHVVAVPPAAAAGSSGGVAGRLTLALGQSRSGRRAIPVVTHTLVDPADPALAHPAADGPEPLAVLEAEAIAGLLESGFPVVVSDRIPVVPSGDVYRPVAASVDEAASAQRLAGDLGVSALVFVTGADDGLPGAGDIDVVEAERHLAGDRRFGPELRAAARFVRAGGELAVITTAAGLPAFDDDAGHTDAAGVGAGTPLRIHRRLARRPSDAPALAAGWC